ncbi:MAG: hypothetical protein JRI71_15325 [Deltaproteobacteria bacterium]|nr:hypothetical protein [Deltaproteobacteria bacterium]
MEKGMFYRMYVHNPQLGLPIMCAAITPKWAKAAVPEGTRIDHRSYDALPTGLLLLKRVISPQSFFELFLENFHAFF